MRRRAAVFLDRDGTIIEDVGYLRQPDDVRLLPGAAHAISLLNRAALAAVVVTNQSGIARGLFSTEEYQAGERRLDQLLARENARLDGHYFCPHLPELTGPCDCRKPGPLLYRQAADELDLDPGRSWWVGDRLRDVLAAEHFGGRGIILGSAESEAEPSASRFPHAEDLASAVDMILSHSQLLSPP